MRKFFATVCAILFIIFTPLTVVATVVQVRLFTPPAIKLLLRSSQIGEHLPQLLSSIFSEQFQQEVSEESEGEEQPLADPFVQFGGQAVFEDALGKVLPAEDVYAILDQSVDTVFNWWKTGRPVEELSVVIDLTRPKQRLAPVVLESVKKYIEDLPTCTAEELKGMQGADLPDVFRLACAPEGFSLDSFAQAGISEEALSGILLASVPDEFNVQDFLQQMQQSDAQQLIEINQRIDSVRRTLDLVQTILRVMQVLMVVCFLLVGFLRLTPAKTFFAWIGWVLVLPGLELLALAGLSNLIPNLVEQNIAVNSEVAEIIPIAQVATALIHTVSQPILWVGLGMTLIGLLSIILGKIFKHSKAKSK